MTTMTAGFIVFLLTLLNIFVANMAAHARRIADALEATVAADAARDKASADLRSAMLNEQRRQAVARKRPQG
jgi:hypothetical protein